VSSGIAVATKKFTHGCHRAVAPEQTLEAVAPFLKRAGITRVADVTGLDYPGVPTVMVTRPNSRSLSVTQGKGLSLEAAKVSGIMEAVEQDHAETPVLALRLARVSELAGSVCDLANLPRFPRSKGPLTAETRLLWAEAECLPTQSKRFVPFEMVHLDLTLPLPECTGFFPLSSNGLASGNTIEEATTHALFELVERDARSLFFLSPRAARDARRVALATVVDPTCRALIDRFQEVGLALAAWDITTDLGIASFLVGLMDREDNAFRRTPLSYGSGAHLDRNVALLRALTEAAQTRLTNIVGTRDDTLPAHLEHARSPERQAAYRAELAPDAATARSFQETPHFFFDSFTRDLNFVLASLAGQGMEQVLRVDLSRPGWPVHVVRLIVPGLEGHIDMSGYVPGERGAARWNQA